MNYFKEILIGILIVVLAIVGFEFLQSHDAGIRLQATIDAQKVVIQTANKAIADRDSQLAKQLSDYEALRKQKLTPQQIVREIPTYIPNLPKPIEQPLPNAPTAQIPTEDLPALRDYYLKCTECGAKLAVDEQDKKDLQGTIVALEKERNAAIKAAKGTFWKNTGKTLLKVGIGVGIGYALHR